MEAPWSIVPARDAAAPVAPAEARARGWLRDLWARTRRSEPTPSDLGPDDAALHPIEQARFERLAPSPPIAAQHAAMDVWRGRVHAGLLLRPDDGGWDAALDTARPAGVDVVAPPRGADAPSGLPEALRSRLAEPEPIHLARLEGWFVRHHDGLTALRALIVQLRDREGPWTADVAPWAWGWLRRQLPEARSLPAAWAPAPLDGDALADWLGTDGSVRERSSGAAPGEAFFRALAQRSGGQAGSARAIWSACLRDGAEAARDDEEGSSATVWVRAPGSVDLPDAAVLERTDLLVVHALLLHGPSSQARLERSLAALRPRVAPALHHMAAHGLAEHGPVADGPGAGPGAHDGARLWRPRPEALPALNARLAAEAFAGAVA